MLADTGPMLPSPSNGHVARRDADDGARPELCHCSSIWVSMRKPHLLRECCCAAALTWSLAVLHRRTADPYCQKFDKMLRDVMSMPSLLGGEEVAAALQIYTVDIDEVPEFTFMYELYDPCTLMVFYRSKPLLIDAGHGPVRKITELSPHFGPSLAALLATATRTALGCPQQAPASAIVVPRVAVATTWRRADDVPDDPPTWEETGLHLASVASGWLNAKAEQWKLREAAATAQSKAEAALQVARAKSAVALETARGRTLAFVQDKLGAAQRRQLQRRSQRAPQLSRVEQQKSSPVVPDLQVQNSRVSKTR